MKSYPAKSVVLYTHRESYGLTENLKQNCRTRKIIRLNFILVILFICFSFDCISQTNKLVVKINDVKVAESLSTPGADIPTLLKSAHKDLENVFKKYDVSGFRQLYPDAITPELRKYFIFETNKPEEYLTEPQKGDSIIITPICKYFEPESLYTPNDFDFKLLRGNDGLRYIGLSYLDLMNAREAWDITKGDPSVIIGIHDNHLYEEHEDLQDKIVKIYDKNVRSSYRKEVDHGTRVGGLIAANSDNNKGISSIAFNCRLAKTSNNKNDLIKMAKNGVKIINISQNWGDYCEADQLMINELTDIYGVTVVAAAGNSNDTTYIYPASYENVISVTSVGHEFDHGTVFHNKKFNWKDCHKKYLDSSSVVVHQHNDKVDICAPGYCILTLCHPESSFYGSGQPTGNLYEVVNGTSFACALVSGVCGLMISVNPDLKPHEVGYILKSTAFDVYSIPENAEYAGLLGAGRVDAYKAVKLASVFNHEPPQLTCPADITFDVCSLENLACLTGLAFAEDTTRIIEEQWNAVGLNASDKSGIKKITYFDTFSGDSPTTIYRVFTAVDCCGNLSQGVQVITILDNTGHIRLGTNINESSGNEINIYPNPTSDILNISGSEENDRVQIYTSDGKLVMEEVINWGDKSLDLRTLESGLYLIVLMRQNKVIGRNKILKM